MAMATIAIITPAARMLNRTLCQVRFVLEYMVLMNYVFKD